MRHEEGSDPLSRSVRLPVSVVIPAYNGEAFVADAIRSVFAQTCLPCEIIVVDDASTDNTIGCVRTMAARAPIRVRWICLAQNSGGPARPINVGVQAAQAPLIAVLDQDDVFLPQRIASQAAVLTAHPDIAFVFGCFDPIRTVQGASGRLRPNRAPGNPSDTAFLRPPSADETDGLIQRHARVGSVAALTASVPSSSRGKSQPQPASAKQQRWLRERMINLGGFACCDADVALRILLQHGNCVGGFPGFTFRRDDWGAVGGLDERLAAAADYDFLCRLCRGGRVAMVPAVHYLIRIHDGNLSRNRLRCYTDELETMTKFVSCAAWPGAANEVRRSIAAKLYQLAVLMAVSGSGAVARRLLAKSLLLDGLSPRALLRAADYPLKVFRRRRRAIQPPLPVVDRKRVVHVARRVSRLYEDRASRRRLRQAEADGRVRRRSLYRAFSTVACRSRSPA
jgi:glycosyltransferase involved in cell wall biosynthesis